MKRIVPIILGKFTVEHNWNICRANCEKKNHKTYYLFDIATHISLTKVQQIKKKNYIPNDALWIYLRPHDLTQYFSVWYFSSQLFVKCSELIRACKMHRLNSIFEVAWSCVARIAAIERDYVQKLAQRAVSQKLLANSVEQCNIKDATM